MLQATRRGTAVRFSSLLTVIIGTVVAVADPATQPVGPKSSRERLPADAARMYAFVTTPHAGELAWQQIPWLTDLQEAIRQAKAEKRPLVLFVSGDEPLEKC